VQAGWRYCPFCNAELAAPSAPGETPSLPKGGHPDNEAEEPLDTEVAKDTTGSGFILAMLAFVVVSMVILLFVSGAPAFALLVLVLGAVVGGILLLYGVGRPKGERSHAELPRPRRPRPAAVGALGGCAFGAVVTGVVALMLLMAALAAIGNAVETCLTCNQPAKPR
jgi:hypothetical protein